MDAVTLIQQVSAMINKWDESCALVVSADDALATLAQAEAHADNMARRITELESLLREFTDIAYKRGPAGMTYLECAYCGSVWYNAAGEYHDHACPVFVTRALLSTTKGDE